MAKQKFGKYEVQSRLGRGGMAEVFLAYHASLDRYVAIKVLHAFLADDKEFRVRFEKEARNIARLNHPNIVQVYDFDYEESSDSYYMVMELVDGSTLKDLIYSLVQDEEKLPLAEVLRIIRESASALAYAHNSGMIHRDVKPANLMIDKNNRVVLTDFGIAKMLDSKQLTVSGGMIGTPAYMSPEQGLGEPGDERSDLYSLGVIMYQLLVGTLPFDAETALGVILMHVNDPIPELQDFDPDIPEHVQDVVHRAMTKDPEDRYQSASEMIADIEACEQKLGIGEVTRLHPPTKLGQAKPTPPPPISTPTPSKPITRTQSLKRDDVAPMQKKLSAADGSGQGSHSRSYLLGVLSVLLLTSVIYLGAMFTGVAPGPNFVSALTTPTSTVTPTSTPSPSPPTETPEAVVVASATPLPPTELPTLTPSPSVVAIMPTEPPTETPNATETLVVAQTATATSCVFDYAIVDQLPEDGEVGGFFRVSEPYTREITFLNTGTCEWGENTSMTFISGEDFDAGPRIFIRESLQVGDEIMLLFEGATPARGNLEPFAGTWQLRTRGQVAIGEPFSISVMVFDPGS